MNEHEHDEEDDTLDAIEELEATITLNTEQLQKEIELFTAHYSRTANRLAEATRLAAMAEVQAKRVAANLRLKIRHATEVSGQKMTEGLLTAAVHATDAWLAAQEEMINATARRDTIAADVKSLDKKERMLDLLARREIAEMRRDPVASTDAAAAEPWRGARVG